MSMAQPQAAALANVNKGLQDHWPSLKDASAMLFVGIARPK